MKMSSCQVAVIGAGPYGLAAAAHLKSAHVETWVFGESMEFWRKQMPVGMLLRSPWDASHIADPDNALTLDQYQAERGVRLTRPVPLDDFVQYGQWFQRQVAPDLDARRVARIEHLSNRFRLVLGDGDTVEAQRVIVAAGIGAFAHRPPGFAELPLSLASHASDHRDLSCFAGRRVVVVGGGQSAIESAALLHESGADVEIVMRAGYVNWLRRSALLHSDLNPFRRLFYPRTDVGPPGLNQIVARPDLFRRFPLDLQHKIAVRSIRPAGAAWLMPRMGGIRITTGHEIVSATAANQQLCITLDDGSKRDIDHAMLATGYRVDISRYAFLAADLAKKLDCIQGYPRLGTGFESSVPGLHFLGAPAAWSFGPLMRFVSGTTYAARALARTILANPATFTHGEKRSWMVTAGTHQSG